MTADVCVLVEGTYPFITGGVSSWLHSLMTNLPEFTFEVVHIGAIPENRRTKYALPANVVGYSDLFIHEPGDLDESDTRLPNASATEIAGIRELHSALASGSDEGLDLLRRHATSWAGEDAKQAFMHSAASWDLLLDRYRDYAAQCSFVDFFWTYRVTHLPLLAILNATLPKARLYHSISTGYAGFAGALAKARTGAPFFITEHGVYTREREIEISQADWIYTQPHAGTTLSSSVDFFRAWWIAMFKFMSRFSYRYCDRLVSITLVNQRYQLLDGADASRMSIIPNGIELERFSGLRSISRVDPKRFVVGFVGRVVPIKDVKTFLKAIKIASGRISGLAAYVVGPIDEDDEYYAECRELVQILDLQESVTFTGRADVLDYYRMMDVLVLTSLSEGQPLVVLEANCVGLPVIATDVGGCRELLEGTTKEDKALGASGLLTASASPQETAEALVRLAKSERLRQKLGKAGQERVRRFYREETLYEAYREMYSSVRSEQIAEVS